MHKYLLHFFLFLILSHSFIVIHGKEAILVVKTAGGEELIEQAREFVLTDIEKAEDYATKALNLGNRENDELLIGKAYFRLFIINLAKGRNEKAIEYAQLTESLFTKLNNYHGLADLYQTWAQIFYIGDNERFEYYSNKAIEFARQSDNYRALTAQYYNNGVKAYYSHDEYLALDYLNKVMTLTDKYSNIQSIQALKAASCLLFGSIYRSFNEHKLCIKYYLKGAYAYEELNDYNPLSLSYANITDAYLEINNLDSAYYFAQKSLQAQQKSGNESSLTYPYTAFFSCYWKSNNYDSAVYYIEKGIEIGERYNMMVPVLILYERAGEFYFQLNDLDKAMYYYKKTEQLSRKLETPEMLLNPLKSIGLIFYEKHQSDSAAYYFNEYIKNDTLKTIEKVQRNVLKLSELRLREQTEYKLSEAKSKRQTLIYFLAGSLLLVVSLSVLLRKIYKQHDKINNINEKLREHQEELKILVDYKSRQLDDKEQQYANLCDNMFNGAVFRIKVENLESLTLRFSFVSSGWETITGLPIDNLDDMMDKVKQRLTEEDIAQLSDSIKNAYLSGSIVDKIFPFNKNGETVWLHMRAALASNMGEAASIDGYMVDETDQKMFEEKLVAAKERAEESDNLKTAFLSNISHEIRTPMNAISGFSNLIVNKQISEEKKGNFLKIINDNCTQLLQIVNDIVEISRIDTEQVVFRLNELSQSEIIGDINAKVISLYREKYANIDIRINENCDKNASTIIKTDKLRLVQVIDYLVDNAAKFTPEGFVEFGVDPEEDCLHFYVKDSGIGISPQNLDKIFDNFTKINPDEKRGTGLGLAIVKKILTKLGGKIWVESELNVGTVFHFTIPFGLNAYLNKKTTVSYVNCEKTF